MGAYARLNKFNGNILVSQHGRILFQRAYGFKDIEAGKKNSLTDIFQLASLTKTFTAALLLKLMEEGKLSVNTRVTDYFPDFHPDKPITVGQLLSHTAGVYEILRNPAASKEGAMYSAVSREKLLSYFYTQPLDFEPGTQFSYSNSGYVLLGIIIEKVTGLPYGQAVKKYLFTPLGMKHSGYDYARLRSNHKTQSYNYISNTRHTKATVWNASFTFAAGGLYSSLGDLYKWSKALNENKFITSKSLAAAQQEQQKGYGYGWFIDSLQAKKVVYHPGNLEGATSYFAMIPADDICLIMLNNKTSTTLEAIGNKLIAILYNKPYTLPKPKKATQLTDSLLTRYSGEYDISEDYRVSIKKQENFLYLFINQEQPVQLFPENENRFFIPDSEMSLVFKSKKEGGIQLTILDGLARKSGAKK